MKTRDFSQRQCVKTLLASVLLCLAMMFCILWPAKAEAAGTHYLTPYQTSNMGDIYNGDVTRSFTMMGTSYRYGVAPNNYTSHKQVLYNLDGQFSGVSMLVGCIDKKQNDNAMMYVYFDEKLVEERRLTTEMITTPVQWNTTGVKQLRIDMVADKSYNDLWYGFANVTGVGGHFYQTEMTVKPSPKQKGMYTHTCTICGDSYTETIPEQKTCKPYLSPYSADGQTVYKQVEGPDKYFTVMGKKYYQGVFASNYTSEKTLLYNLGQKYTSVTFKIGHMDGGNVDNGTLYVYADGSTSPMKTLRLTGDMLSKEVTLPVSGVTQLKLFIQADKSYNDVFYAIYDMKYTARSSKSHSYTSEVTLAADYGQSGIRTYTCNDCGLTYTKEIPALSHSLSGAKLSLPKTAYNYTGKPIKPTVTVTYNGAKLIRNIDYTVTYKNNTKIGKASITVTGKGNYKGTRSINFTIKVETSKTYSSGNLEYKITSAGKKTVQVTGMVKATTSVSIPSTIKIYGTVYKVTAVANKAFYKETKLKSVTIGASVQTIGTNAFAGCKNLSKITVKTTGLKSVGSNALKTVRKNAQIVIPRKYAAKYQKLFTGKGQTIKIVKK
ncbi:MAG: NPCBM/NEW2 domain-containing protein [Lachnospiraceae bacterium]|nr:NPCBM/NEW2 domain-containing protein [Lachnospiraceae bacterium]